jgi:hypothetical protein
LLVPNKKPAQCAGFFLSGIHHTQYQEVEFLGKPGAASPEKHGIGRVVNANDPFTTFL